MRNCIISMPSYAYAIKAQRLLASRGIECMLRRNEHSSVEGCGYSLDVNGNCSEIKEILADYSIPFKSLRNEVE